MRFSKTTGGFYPTSVEYPNLPSDLITVTEAQYTAAMERAAGETLDVVNGALVIVAAPAIPLATHLANALSAINNYYASTVQKLVGNPTQVEKDTWALKLAVANAITAGTTLHATGQAFLTAAGVTTTEEKNTWAATVIAHASKCARVAGLAEKLRDAARTAVKAATSEAAIKTALDTHKALAEAAEANLPTS